jgi:hypothetical protein
MACLHASCLGMDHSAKDPGRAESSSVFTSYTKTYVRPANFLRRRSSDKDDTVTTKTDMSNDERPMIMQTG